MDLKYHLFESFLVAILFYPIFGLSVWIIFAAGSLADVDHYLIYIYRFRNLNLKNAYAYFKKLNDARDFYPVFHMLEVILAIFLIGIFYKPFLLVSIGLFFHILLDIYEEKKLNKTDRNFCFCRKLRIFK